MDAFPLKSLPSREQNVIKAALLGYEAWIQVLGDEMNIVGCNGGTLVCAHAPSGPLRGIVEELGAPPDPTFRLCQVSKGRPIQWNLEPKGWAGSNASAFDSLADTALCSLGYEARPVRKSDLRKSGKALGFTVEPRALQALTRIAGKMTVSAGYWPKYSDGGSHPRHLRFEITPNKKTAAPGPAFGVMAFVGLMWADLEQFGVKRPSFSLGAG